MKNDFEVIAEFLSRELAIVKLQKAIAGKFLLDPKGKIGRQEVHDFGAALIGSAVNRRTIELTRLALERLRVVPCVSRGRQYYRGLAVRQDHQKHLCCACVCHGKV